MPPVKKPAAGKALKKKAAPRPAKPVSVVEAQPVKTETTQAAKPAVKPVTVKVEKTVTLAPAKPARRNINVDTTLLMDNFRKFSTENPAMMVVGIVAVTLALVLMLSN